MGIIPSERTMYLGIEIGGTKLQLGLGRGDGIIVALERTEVNPAAGAEGIRKQILAAVPQLLAKAQLDRGHLRGVGIGFGGPTDDTTRTVIRSHQIAGWDGFPLADWVSDLVGVPAVLCNDADVAGLAEALFGAGKGMSPIFYITVGTGVGGGLIIDGQIYRGVGRGAAEIGHLRVPHLADDFDEAHATVENFASGEAISAHAAFRERLRESDLAEVRKHNGDGVMTAKGVASAAREGDAEALEILENAWVALAEGICAVIALLCPRRIVIGGGVSLMGEELFFAPLRARVAERVFEPFRGLTDIVPAALGEEMVVHGALALARQRL
jgi:glucokinase